MQNNFDKKFTDFKTLDNEMTLLWLLHHFLLAVGGYKAPAECQMELINLQCDLDGKWRNICKYWMEQKNTVHSKPLHCPHSWEVSKPDSFAMKMMVAYSLDSHIAYL